MLFPIVFLLALQPAPPGTAEVDGSTWRALNPDQPEAPEQRLLPWAAFRDVEAEPVKDGLKIRARYQIRTQRPGYFHGVLLGPTAGARVESVTLNGRPAAIHRGAEGTVVLAFVRNAAEVVMEAFVPGDPERGVVVVDLLAAVRGRVKLVAKEGLSPEVRHGSAKEPALRVGADFWTGQRHVQLALRPKREPTGDRPPVAIGHCGIGLTVGDGAIRGRARVGWEIRHGKLDAVSFTARGVGSDLQMEGANLGEWKRSGDRIDVELLAPATGRIDLQLRWTQPIAKGDEGQVELPQIEPQGTLRTETALQLARDGEVEVLPDLPEWEGIAAAKLPAWAEGLVEGTTTAAFRSAGAAGGRLDLLRFVPVAGPPVVVDLADYEIATSREGRTLVSVRYEVRNERAAHLRIVPPPGSRIIGARVDGETALAAAGRDGAWLLPLRRSLETVTGLLSFPVEVTIVGESEEWERREKRDLKLPRLDAPIAATRLTLYLPPGYTSRLDPGDGDVVDAFSEGEGIAYGLGVGSGEANVADALYREAVQNWMANEFEAAQANLDDLTAMGASNANIERLQSNLDVVQGKSKGKKRSVVLERRVKEQARARASADERKQSKIVAEAEELRSEGRYDAARRRYRKALEIGKRLEKLEQAESVEQVERQAVLSEKLAEVEHEEKTRRRQEESARRKAPAKKKAAKEATGKAKPRAKAPDTTTVTLDGEDMKSIPVGDKGRDFSATIEAAPVATKDAAGISIAGATAAEPEPEPDAPDIVSARAMEEADEEDLVLEAAPAVRSRRIFGGGRSRWERKADRKARREARRSRRGGISSRGIGMAKKAAPALDPADMPDAAPITNALRAPPAPPPAATPAPAGGEAAGPAAARPVATPGDEAAVGGVAGDVGGVAGLDTGVVMMDELEAPEEVEEELDDDIDEDAIDGRLPDPKATASALLAAIPRTGEAVLYEHLLLEADAPYEVAIDAREPLRRKGRHR
jgi:tetratricopeptide (TPR) repeat protein